MRGTSAKTREVHDPPAPPPPSWLKLTFEPVALFSLRSSHSTSAGGKTLLVPTPYAVKLALIDAAIRTLGPSRGEAIFSLVKPAAIAILPSERVCVTNTFLRSLKKSRGENSGEDEEGDDGGEGMPTFTSTLRYREFCFMSGVLTIHLGLRSESLDELAAAAQAVNYFGARGGMFQLVGTSRCREIDQRCAVVDPLGWSPPNAPLGGTACVLDDLGPEATLARISPYSPEGARWHADRRATMALLPLRRVSSGSHWTTYERIGS